MQDRNNSDENKHCTMQPFDTAFRGYTGGRPLNGAAPCYLHLEMYRSSSLRQTGYGTFLRATLTHNAPSQSPQIITKLADVNFITTEN